MDEGLTTIHLSGRLGATFGKTWKLRVSSPAEAIRAIDVNVGGKLRAYILNQGKKGFYKVAVGKKNDLLSKDELSNRSGASDIYIMPTVKGAKGGLGKILAGVAIIALAFVPGVNVAIAGAIGGGLTAGSVGLGIGLLGASMILGGITQLLTPTPNFNNNTLGDGRDTGSTIFNGNSTAVSQGGSVGVVYGRALVVPMPISISFWNEDIKVDTVVNTTEYEQVELPGGGYQWRPKDTSRDEE
jgi:predicted phage tail protein